MTKMKAMNLYKKCKCCYRYSLILVLCRCGYVAAKCKNSENIYDPMTLDYLSFYCANQKCRVCNKIPYEDFVTPYHIELVENNFKIFEGNWYSIYPPLFSNLLLLTIT